MMEDHQSGSRVNWYITQVVQDLFDEFKTSIANRIEGLDFYQKWYVLVAFILFVMKIRHQKTDAEGKELLNKGIDYYIKDTANEESYLNYFGNEYFRNGIYNPKPKNLINDMNVYMRWYKNTWNQNIKSDPDIAVSMVFAENIATDNDKRHITLAFRFLYNQFSRDGDNSTIKMFNCRK